MAEDYTSRFSGPEIDARLAKIPGLETGLSGKQDTITDLQEIRSGAAAGATAVQPSALNSKQDVISDLPVIRSGAALGSTSVQPAEFNELKDEVDTIGNGAYEEAWDGDSTPVVADIPAGVVVTYGSASYTGTLAASASTVDKIYLVSDGNGNYDRYTTVEANGAYSWKKVGSTAIPLSNYATRTQVSQLQQEVHQLAGKFYGVFASANDLPEGDAIGYAFVGSENPYAIWNFDGSEWSDSGSVANGITGEPGVGFASIFTPQPYDGTMIIVLSNNDTITVDLNHQHPQYLKYVMLNSESDMPANPDSTTLYMWPQTS